MLELLLCSLLTILPDYLYRRYAQGKRLGREINLYSVWFELRWGIVACLMLTVGLITVIFYFHPTTTSATLFYRSVPSFRRQAGASPRSTWASATRSRKGRRCSGSIARSRRRRSRAPAVR